jgi:ribosome-associated protein
MDGADRAEGEGVRVTAGRVIPWSELEWRFSGSGGPGGQHANTANTRVELLFSIADSATFDSRQRARLLDRFGPVVRVVVSSSRSQARNRDLAVQRLAERLRDGLRVQAPRRATKPTRGAREARLRAKRAQGDRKAMRRRPSADD